MRISKEKQEKIKESILSILFNSPKALFTASIAREIARDEEFTKRLLIELEGQGLVKKVNKDKMGRQYKRRMKWSLTTRAYDAYKQLIS